MALHPEDSRVGNAGNPGNASPHLRFGIESKVCRIDPWTRRARSGSVLSARCAELSNKHRGRRPRYPGRWSVPHPIHSTQEIRFVGVGAIVRAVGPSRPGTDGVLGIWYALFIAKYLSDSEIDSPVIFTKGNIYTYIDFLGWNRHVSHPGAYTWEKTTP